MPLEHAQIKFCIFLVGSISWQNEQGQIRTNKKPHQADKQEGNTTTPKNLKTFGRSKYFAMYLYIFYFDWMCKTLMIMKFINDAANKK